MKWRGKIPNNCHFPLSCIVNSLKYIFLRKHFPQPKSFNVTKDDDDYFDDKTELILHFLFPQPNVKLHLPVNSVSISTLHTYHHQQLRWSIKHHSLPSVNLCQTADHKTVEHMSENDHISVSYNLITIQETTSDIIARVVSVQSRCNTV